MICYNCNKEIPDTSKFCPVCGAPVEYPTEQAAPQVDYSAETTVLDQGQVVVEPAVAFTPVEPAPKKKGGGKAVKWLLGLGIPVVAVVLAVCLLLPSLFPGGVMRAVKGFAVKTFGDDNDYLRYVEAEQFGDYVDTVTTLYGRVVDTYKDRNNIAVDGNLNITLGDKAFELIKTFAPVDESYFNWLESADIKFNVNSKDGNASVDAAVKVNGKDVITGNVAINEDGDIFAQVPELNEQPIYVDAETSGISNALTGNSVLNTFGEMDLDQYLPTADKLNTMLKRYIKLATECIDDVTSEKVALEAGGIENEYTALTVDFDEELICRMALAALEEAETDKDIEDIINQFFGLVEEMGGAEDMDASDVYDNLLDAIGEGKDSVEEYLSSLEGDGETFIRLIDYVDGNSKIIGRALQVPLYTEDESGNSFGNIFSYHEVTNGSNYGMFMGLQIDNVICFVDGSGKKSGTKVSIENGTISVIAEGNEMDVINFATKDLNTADLEEGFFNGTITVTPADGLWKLIFNADAEDLAGGNAPVWVTTLLDIKVEISGKGNNATNSDCTLSLKLGEDMLVALNLAGKQTGGSGVDFPNEDDCAWADDNDDMNNWASDIDLEKVLEKLEDAGVPSDIMDMFDGLLTGSTRVPAVNAGGATVETVY